MLEVDLHIHSFFSLCGIHSHLEMLARAKKMGMKAVAFTDHGPKLHSRINDTWLERLQEPLDGIRMLKGIECNLGDARGEIDLPQRLLKYMDIVLLGIHQNTPKNQGSAVYTDLLIAALQNNPCIDMIAHLNNADYPSDMRAVIQCARDCACAIELNNSKTRLGRVDDSVTLEMLSACKDIGCRVAVTSDAHGINELGDDSAAAPLLEQVGFPEQLLISRNAETAYAFIEERKVTKV